MTKYIASGASISPCGRYRYRLWREWRLHPLPAQWDMWTEEDGTPCLDGEGKQIGEPLSCVFVMLNPSTADGEQDDPTIRRCVGFAKSFGFDRLEVVNLFAYRATNPAELLALNHNDDPVGEGNALAFRTAIYRAGVVVCAWGANGGHLGQDETALGWIDSALEYRDRTVPVMCLGRTLFGHPKHPLYVPRAQPLIPFDGAE